MTPDLHMPDSPPERPDPLIVIPCLNEAEHLHSLLAQLEKTLAKTGGLIVVVDGGSTDETVEIANTFKRRNPAIVLLHNPARIQSVAVNLAVARFGQTRDILIRIDAHCRYPDDYCETLIDVADRTGADSVVVSMIAHGQAPLQSINAAAQNAPIGNGGSRHRMRAQGGYVDHGHHALIRLAAFRTLGGYDTSFTHNEDAEFDVRMAQSGHRIWLTAETEVIYYPRSTLRALARQYFNYGKGRAQNLRKHRIVPRLRQAKVMLVLPALALALLSGLHAALALPALLWAGICIPSGLRSALSQRDPKLALIGLSAMVMHVAWSAGFWRRMLSIPARHGRVMR